MPKSHVSGKAAPNDQIFRALAIHAAATSPFGAGMEADAKAYLMLIRYWADGGCLPEDHLSSSASRSLCSVHVGETSERLPKGRPETF